MSLVPARCPQCGGILEVDETQEAALCRYCGTPFITEKAIHQYITNVNTTVNQTTNINADTVHIHQDEINRFFVIEGGTLIRYNGKLRKIVIPEGVTAIGDNVFAETDFDEIVLPASVVEIGKAAFVRSTGGFSKEKHRKITLPQGSRLKKAGERAFADQYIPMAVVPRSVEELSEDSFWPGQLICYEGSEEEFIRKFPQCYNKEPRYEKNVYGRTELLYKTAILGDYRGCGKTSDGYYYAYGEKETYIYAFDDLWKKREVFAPPSVVDGHAVTGISIYAYQHSKESFKEVRLPEGLREIPAYAMDKAWNTEKIFVPKTVVRIGKRAMSGQKLREVEFEKGMLLEEWDPDCVPPEVKFEMPQVGSGTKKTDANVYEVTVAVDPKIKGRFAVRLASEHDHLWGEERAKAEEKAFCYWLKGGEKRTIKISKAEADSCRYKIFVQIGRAGKKEYLNGILQPGKEINIVAKNTLFGGKFIIS